MNTMLNTRKVSTRMGEKVTAVRGTSQMLSINDPPPWSALPSSTGMISLLTGNRGSASVSAGCSGDPVVGRPWTDRAAPSGDPDPEATDDSMPGDS